VLLSEFAGDVERLARFHREAEVLAVLNHPHIGSIYDLENYDGLQFLVLELVEGETLEGRIARGLIPVEEALSIAEQIVEAIEAAHEQGIVHRDLKPANIKLSQKDRVKVLDFGLAKVWETIPDPREALTGTSLSTPGVILGTTAYMSPEQSKGQVVDRTTDVWAFGCVLYEMLTGTRVFEGQSVTEVLAAVIRQDPDWDRLPAGTPASIRRLLRRCLQKDHKRRLQWIGDARLEIADATDSSEADAAKGSANRSSHARIAWIGFAIAALIAVLLGLWSIRNLSSSPPRELRVDIAVADSSDKTSLAISPDGLKIVYVADSNGSGLWLRSLESTEPRKLPGTENAAFPFWSPDNHSVGFMAGGKLKRIDISSGLVRTITDAAGRGGTWNSNGIIVYSPGVNTALFKISENGEGKPVPVTRLKGQQGTHRHPWFLPDGHHFLFWGVEGGVETRAIYVGDLDNSEPRRILNSEVAAIYAAGHLFFFRAGSVFAQPFDADHFTLQGTPALVAENVVSNQGLNDAAMSASVTGSVVYHAANPDERQLAWFDRDGKEIQRIGVVDKSGQTGVSLSPDGRSTAVTRTVDGNIDVWLVDTSRGVLSRFTSAAWRERFPVWSPDGTHVAYSANPNGSYDLYEKSTNGSEKEQVLLSTSASKGMLDWSADGHYILYRNPDPKTGDDIWALHLDDSRKEFPAVQSEFSDERGQFSPDGKWIAYESNSSGRFEIYIQPFPGPGQNVQISVNGGTQVRWQRDGKSVYFIAPDNRLTQVPLRFAAGGNPEPGREVSLFTTHVGGSEQQLELAQYAVSPDGKQFLMNAVTQESHLSPITLVLNWKPH
jgi:serine/threonine protein kinase